MYDSPLSLQELVSQLKILNLASSYIAYCTAMCFVYAMYFVCYVYAMYFVYQKYKSVQLPPILLIAPLQVVQSWFQLFQENKSFISRNLHTAYRSCRSVLKFEQNLEHFNFVNLIDTCAVCSKQIGPRTVDGS